MHRRLALVAIFLALAIAASYSTAFPGAGVSLMMGAGTATSSGPAIASLTPASQTITSGASANLSWTSNQPSCVSPGSLGNAAIPGFSGLGSDSTSVSPTSTTTYSIQCGTATAAATVTVTGGGGTIACDVGPPYTGNVPAAATQAGFTHCFANYDFTQTASFTNSGDTYTWSNLSSWFTCTLGSSNAHLLWYLEGYNIPCNTSHQNITTVGGVQVLALSFLTSDVSSSIQILNDIGTSTFANPGVNKVSFPVGLYVEEVYANANPNPCGSACIMMGISTFGINNPNQVCSVAMDFDEIYAHQSLTNSGVSLWNLNHCSPPDPGQETSGVFQSVSPIPQTANHWITYGALMTADNNSTSGHFAMCNYDADGAVSGLPASAFRACVTQTVIPPSDSRVFQNRDGIYLQNGAFGVGASTVYTSNLTNYWQRITVWSCPPNGTTNQCYNNPVITTHP